MDEIERCGNTPDMFDNTQEYTLNPKGKLGSRYHCIRLKYHYKKLRCFGVSIDDIITALQLDNKYRNEKMKLSVAQARQVDLLSDGEWHNIYNNGIKGLAVNSLYALLERGLVETKRNDPKIEISTSPKDYWHPKYDQYWKLVENE